MVDDRIENGPICYSRSEQTFKTFNTGYPTKLYCFRPKGHEGDHWGHRNFDDDSNPKRWVNATADNTVKAPEVQAKGTDLDSGLLVLGEGVKALQEENKRLKAELEKVQITNSKLGINLSLARSNADEMQRREANAWARVDALRELCGISPLSSIEGINVRAEKAEAERDAARTDAEKWETRANEMGNKFSAAEARLDLLLGDAGRDGLGDRPFQGLDEPRVAGQPNLGSPGVDGVVEIVRDTQKNLLGHD